MLLPESRDPSPGRLDLVSAALSLCSVLLVIFGVTRIAEHGAGQVAALAIVAGLAIGAVFLRRQQRLTTPLLDLGLFRSAMFVAALAAMFVSVFVIAGTDLFMAQYLQLVHGISPFVAGLWLLPGVIGLIVGSMLVPQLARRIRPGLVVAWGLAVAAVGLLVLAGLREDSGLELLVIGMTLMGLGIGPVGALGTDIVVSAAPAERAGAASALSETATELGGALGIAILGSIGTAVYRAQLDDRIAGGLPSRIAETSRDTLGGAVEAARHVSAQHAENLLHAARVAFTQGLEIAALAGAAIGAAMALVAALKLRTARVET
jgi:DHA2 family multidrug resistance protein-like MFS transporter